MIRIRNLRKRFGSLEVLQGIDADIATGRVTGIVGPNAAGKTTLIKSILGLTRPDSGTLEVGGVKVNGDESYRSRIGYMPQIAKFPSNLTGAELLAMLRELRPDVTDADESLIRNFGLGLELSKKLNELSGGTRQKINAVAAFMFNPALMILDEPTAGLDPRSSSVLKDRILAERRAGKTFIITSHVMTELEELADEVIFISDGKVRFSGSVRQIKDLTRQANLERAVAELMEGGVAA
jgi:Cu-processing system ATP-binding protein